MPPSVRWYECVDRKFTVTEFSLVWWWVKQMRQVVSPAYAQRYHLPAGTQNWQVIGAALKEPFPKAQWDDFLRLSPWFEEHKHYSPDFTRLAESPRFLEPDQALFAQHPPVGKDWPVSTRVGRRGATMVRDGNRYLLADVTTPWRMHFGLVPIDIGDPEAIGVPSLDASGK